MCVDNGTATCSSRSTGWSWTSSAGVPKALVDTRTLGKPREIGEIGRAHETAGEAIKWAGAQTQLASLSHDYQSLAMQIYLALSLHVKGRIRAGIERTTKSEASAVDEA
eukprot:1719119-Amphidinium_carterae.1